MLKKSLSSTFKSAMGLKLSESVFLESRLLLPFSKIITLAAVSLLLPAQNHLFFHLIKFRLDLLCLNIFSKGMTLYQEQKWSLHIITKLTLELLPELQLLNCKNQILFIVEIISLSVRFNYRFICWLRSLDQVNVIFHKHLRDRGCRHRSEQVTESHASD